MPEGWAWCRLTNVAITELGKTLDAKKNKGESYDYLCALNVKWYTFDFTTLKQIRLEEKEKERYLVRKGDLLICEGGDVGRSAIWESDNPIYYQNALHRVRFYQSINQYFFLYILNHYKNLGLIDDVSGGVTIKHFTQNSMQKLIFPLPPLAEQERIVSVIKSIFSQIDTLDQNKSDLQTAIKQTKSKILDLAIHGKLVPQDTNDEPAEQLLKRIATSDNRPYEKVVNEPFEIPDSWKWVKLSSICNKLVDGDHNPPKGVEEKTEYIMASSRNINYDRLDDLENVRYLTKEIFDIENNRTKAEKGDIFFTSVGTIGRSCIYSGNYNICFQRSVTVLNSKINNQFLKYFFDSSFFQTYVIEHSTGTAQMGFYLKEMANSPIAIPPIDEQVRIVNKISELFSTLEQILKNII